MIYKTYLVEVDIIVKGHNLSDPGVPQPSNDVPTNGQQNESHVELQRLSRSFGRDEAITHDVESVFVHVLNELPREQADHDQDPERDHPNPLPVLFEIVEAFHAHSPDSAPVSEAVEVLAQGLACVA